MSVCQSPIPVFCVCLFGLVIWSLGLQWVLGCMQFLSVSFSLLIQSLLFDQKRTPSNVSAQYLKCVCVMSRDSLLNYSCPTCNLKGRDLDILFCCPAADVFDSPFNFEILFCIFRDSLLAWFIFYFSTYRLFFRCLLFLLSDVHISQKSRIRNLLVSSLFSHPFYCCSSFNLIYSHDFHYHAYSLPP